MRHLAVMYNKGISRLMKMLYIGIKQRVGVLQGGTGITDRIYNLEITKKPVGC